MKRSEINARIRDACEFFAAMNFRLPPWSARSPGEWRGRASSDSEIVGNMLGWDLTDFGSGDFGRRGLLLFTLRNGAPGSGAKSYAEKIMIVGEEQETPLHFHWSKTEDIIVRGGGNLALQFYGSTAEEGLSAEALRISVDGIPHGVESGGYVLLSPGESVCIPPGLYHRFFGEKGSGRVLVGEVSAVNDDRTDNRFFETIGRFPDIDEDEAPARLLVSDYRDYL
jgi:hypothetical protein